MVLLFILSNKYKGKQTNSFDLFILHLHTKVLRDRWMGFS